MIKINQACSDAKFEMQPGVTFPYLEVKALSNSQIEYNIA